MKKPIILKFGGTSLRYGINHIIDIIKDNIKLNYKPIIVVSAFSQVTNILVKIIENGSEYQEYIDEIIKIHLTEIPNKFEIFEEQKKIINDLISSLCDNVNKKNLDNKENILISYGEILSSIIIGFILKNNHIKNHIVSHENNIVVDDNTNINYYETKENVYSYIIPNINNNDIDVVIVRGFLCRNLKNKLLTLGRGGSDYTATILGKVIDEVNIIKIYTDVNGIYTADPKKVNSAKTINEISISEIKEFSYFGAKIIYSLSILPLINTNKDIFIINTFNRHGDYTKIVNTNVKSSSILTGITSLNGFALINIYGPGMIGKVGFLKKIIEIISNEDINIPFITQASSEQSITICIEVNKIDILNNSIKNTLENEISTNIIENIRIEKDISIISIIGNNLINNIGSSGKIFSLLGDNNINIIAISQGSSENSISFVIRKDDEIKCLNSIHHLCFLT